MSLVHSLQPGYPTLQWYINIGMEIGTTTENALVRVSTSLLMLPVRFVVLLSLAPSIQYAHADSMATTARVVGI